ncbi:hypothetical protein, partial [Escherichia coli]|uniref:hypothetical protein n=2 Tax=Escherichia coli TaxID=562 RepID=UPI001BB47DDD
MADIIPGRYSFFGPIKTKLPVVNLHFLFPQPPYTAGFFYALPLPPDNHHLPVTAFITGTDVL